MNSIAKSTFDNLLMRHAIGFDPNFFDRVAEAPNFPPHTIEQWDDNHFVLTLAVAGFSEAEIDITLHNDLLTIAGSKPGGEAEPAKGYRMLYSGIALRDFSFQTGKSVLSWLNQCVGRIMNNLHHTPAFLAVG